MIKRVFDILLAGGSLFPIILIATIVRTTSKGPALYWSKRVVGTSYIHDA